jgi:hypothetical protein
VEHAGVELEPAQLAIYVKGGIDAH